MMIMDKLAELNSATKYPSIETYHVLGEKGRLTGDLGPFAGIGEDEEVVLTEKVNGGNGRIVLLADGDWFLGSREDLLYARGDRLTPPTPPYRDLVEAMRPIAEAAADRLKYNSYTSFIQVIFMEVYGRKIGQEAKQYTRHETLGARLFDIAYVDPYVLKRSREEVVSRHGQTFAQEPVILRAADTLGVPCTPRLGTVKGSGLPQSLEKMQEWLEQALPTTQVALDETGLGRAEGIVLRTTDRSRIAKARFEDYARTLSPQPQRKQR